RLFQFLNGLEEHFSHQRSQILMIDPLPSVEVTCSLLQQEESHILLFKSSAGIESTALLSKGIMKEKCSICGFKWHPPDKCWEKVGYPPWHAKFKGSQQFSNCTRKVNWGSKLQSTKKAFEIGFSTKRKLGFVKGIVVRSATDENHAELWDTCNNIVICWIVGSISESIARSIMFVGTASEIWQQSEKKFSLSDGSRSVFGKSWIPILAVVTLEISAFLAALNKQKEEQRLFQFLNGLEEHFSHQRSQILMIDPLPSVEVTCSLLQQEESHILLFKT
nr:cysteamine dioxygenase [Tanacetum cinerariifolium]